MERLIGDPLTASLRDKDIKGVEMAGTGYPEFDRELSRITEQLDRVKDIPGKIAEIKGIGEAADGFIKVTVDSTGKLEAIEINPRAMRMDSQTLTEELLRAAQAAYDAMQASIQEVVTPLMVDDNAFGRLAENRGSELGISENATDVAASIINSPDPIREMMKNFESLKRKL